MRYGREESDRGVSLQSILGDSSSLQSPFNTSGSMRRRQKRRAPLPPGMRTSETNDVVLRIVEPSDRKNESENVDLNEPLVELRSIASQLQKIEQLSQRAMNPFESDTEDQDNGYYNPKNPFSEDSDEEPPARAENKPIEIVKPARGGYRSFLRHTYDGAQAENNEASSKRPETSYHSFESKAPRTFPKLADDTLRKNALLNACAAKGNEKSASTDLKQIIDPAVPTRTSSFIAQNGVKSPAKPVKTASVDVNHDKASFSRTNSSRQTTRPVQIEKPKFQRASSVNQGDNYDFLKKLKDRVSEKFQRPENLHVPDKAKPSLVKKPKVRIPTDLLLCFAA